MTEIKIEEKKLINQLMPKVSEYFKKNKTLQKSEIKQLISFLKFPDIKESNDIETFWKEISLNSSGNQITQELFTKNLNEYIHNHSKELIHQDTLISNVTKFLERPVKLIEDIDPDNELMFELYRLLATIEFSENKDIPLLALEKSFK